MKETLNSDILKKQEEYYQDVKNKALEFIKDNLFRPEQLEDLETVRKRISALKESTDNKVKSTLSYHIRGIREGLTELHNSKNNIKQLEENLAIIAHKMDEFKGIQSKIKSVKDSANKLNCLNESLNLLNQLFGIPDTISNTKRYIESGNYLEAHFNIRTLENIRDNLYIQHCKNSKPSSSLTVVDWPLSAYFIDLIALVNTLFEKIERIVIDYQNLENPANLVTALRIIEREEMVDEYWLEESKNGLVLMPPKRPRQFRASLLSKLESSVSQRITDTLSDINTSDKLYVTKLLERIRSLVIKDLLYIQNKIVSCFPPEYNILQNFTFWYHKSITTTIEMLVSDWNDQNSKISDPISVLIWVRDYKNSNLFGHPELDPTVMSTIEASPNVLDEKLESKLYNRYVAGLYVSMTGWAKKLVQTEAKDWRQSKTKPDVGNSIYRTLLPTMMLNMLLPNLDSSGSFSFEIKQRTYKGCLQAIESLINDYTMEYDKYSFCHFNPDKVTDHSTNQEDLPSNDGYPLFTDYSIAIANNCQNILDSINILTNKANKDDSINDTKEDISFLKTPAGIEITNDNNERIISINQSVKQLANKCCQMLNEDFINTMQPAFENLFTRNWQQNYSAWSDAFFEALDDFSSILNYMIPTFRINVFRHIDQHLSILYIKNIISRKMKFSNESDKKAALKQIQSDSKKFIDFFKNATATDNEEELFVYAINLCVGLIAVGDVTFVRFDLNKIAHLYSDFTENHATAILQSRGDMSRDDIRSKVKEIDYAATALTANKNGLFKNINV